MTLSGVLIGIAYLAGAWVVMLLMSLWLVLTVASYMDKVDSDGE